MLTQLLLLLLLLLKIKYSKRYITTEEFNKLTSQNFSARLAQTNLASKNDIANFVKKTNFDEKLKTVTSNKNELNELSKEVKAMPRKELTKYLTNTFSILNGAKYFSAMLIQINMCIVVMVLDVIHIQNFHYLTCMGKM